MEGSKSSSSSWGNVIRISAFYGSAMESAWQNAPPIRCWIGAPKARVSPDRAFGLVALIIAAMKRRAGIPMGAELSPPGSLDHFRKFRRDQPEQ